MMPPPNIKPTPLLQFRAGEMAYADGIVTAKEAKGHLSFVPHGEGVVHAVWTGEGAHRTTVLKKGKVRASFASKCTTGRVLVLEDEDKSVAPHFFWLQDQSTERDEEYLKKIQEILKPRASASGKPVSYVALKDFKRILAELNAGGPHDIRLVDVVASPKVLEAISADRDFFASRLGEHLPKMEASVYLPPNTLQEEVKNVHTRAAAKVLDKALHDRDTFNQLCQQLDLPPIDADTVPSVSAFISAITKSMEEKKE